MQIAKKKIKTRFTNVHTSRFFISIFCIVTRTLKTILELNNSYLKNNENLRKIIEV